jgi:AbrB family looped-hinge helix DNA binding protein
MIISKIGRRGQITLPRSIRQALSLKEGDHIAFVHQDDEIILQPLNRTLLDLRGTVPTSGPQDFEAIRKQVLETRANRAASDEA